MLAWFFGSSELNRMEEETRNGTPRLKAANNATVPLEAAGNAAFPVDAAVNDAFPLEAAVNTAFPLVAAANTAFPLVAAANTAFPLLAAANTAFPLEAAANTAFPLVAVANTIVTLETSCNAALPLGTRDEIVAPLEADITRGSSNSSSSEVSQPVMPLPQSSLLLTKSGRFSRPCGDRQNPSKDDFEEDTVTEYFEFSIDFERDGIEGDAMSPEHGIKRSGVTVRYGNGNKRTAVR